VTCLIEVVTCVTLYIGEFTYECTLRTLHICPVTHVMGGKQLEGLLPTIGYGLPFASTGSARCSSRSLGANLKRRLFRQPGSGRVSSYQLRCRTRATSGAWPLCFDRLVLRREGAEHVVRVILDDIVFYVAGFWATFWDAVQRERSLCFLSLGLVHKQVNHSGRTPRKRGIRQRRHHRFCLINSRGYRVVRFTQAMTLSSIYFWTGP
jgi:hypothetical protein